MYLGMEWQYTELGKTKVHSKKYTKESISQVEKRIRIIIRKENFPINLKLYSELGDTPLLD